jgi:hypothetical protein
MAKAPDDIKKSVAELLAIREEHLAKAEELHKSAKMALKDEATEIWAKIKHHFGELEEKFKELDLKDDLKDFMSDKLDDLSAIKELIEEKKAEQKARKSLKTSGNPRRTFTDEQKQQILSEYDTHKTDGKGAQYLKDHGVTYSTVSNWRKALAGKGLVRRI